MVAAPEKETMSKAKPFLKWVGGKSQLLEQLKVRLPADFAQKKDITYVACSKNFLKERVPIRKM